MQIITETSDRKPGKTDYQGNRPLEYQPGHNRPGKKEVAAHRKRNDFLTTRFRPTAMDFLIKEETDAPLINLTTSENFDYLYRSALRYTGIMNLKLPFRARKGSNPRINIIALYKAMDEILPEHVNLEKKAGRLHFCLYRFHDWQDDTLFWIPVDFIERISVPLRQAVREFIRQFVRHHGLGTITESWYYELAQEELYDWENRDSDASSQEIRRNKRLAASYESGKIAKVLKRMGGKPFCTGWEEKIREYRSDNKAEQKLLELIKEGMKLITPESPRLVQYHYDWAYEENPDFLPIELNRQIMLAYSINDALTKSMEHYFNSDYQETYAITPTTSMYLTPETDGPFRMDDYPERLLSWMNRFIEHVSTYF